MSESLPLVTTIVQPVSSLEPGTNVDDQPLWNGTTWVIAPQTSLADPLIMSDAAGVVAPGNVTRGVLYKQAASDGLWWLTDGIGPLDLTAAAVAAPHAPVSLDLFVVNPALPAVSNNYTTVATAMAAALLTAPTAAAPAVVHITPGTYNEAITLRDNIYLVADAQDTVILTQTMDSAGPGTLFGMRNVNVVSAAGPALNFPGGSGTSYFHNCTFTTSDAVSAAVRLAAGTQLVYFDNCRVVNTNLLTSMAVETVLGSDGRLWFKRCVLGAAGGVSYDNEIRQNGAPVSAEWSSGRVWFTATNGSTVVQFCNFSSGATANPMFNITAPASVFAISNSFFSGPTGVTGSYATGTGTFQYGGNTLRTSGATNNVLRTVTTDLPYIMDGAVDDNATAEDLAVLTVNPNKPASNGNYQTIAAAYAAAVADQTIMITAGTYNEDLTLTKSNVVLRAFDIRKGTYSVLVGENNTWTFNAGTYIHGIDFSGASGVNPRLRLSGAAGWVGGQAVVLYYCRIDSGAVPVSAGTDWTANNPIGAVRISFNNCGFNSGGSLRPAIDCAQDNSLVMASCGGSGIINHTSTAAMTMTGGSWSGHVLLSTNLVALGIHARFTNVQGFFPEIGQACIQSTGNFQNIWVQDCFMGSDPTAPAQISVTGANCLLEHGNLTYRPRTLGVDANDTILVTNASSSVKTLDRAGDHDPAYTVNVNRPVTSRNFVTVQAAVTAAEAAVVAATQTVTATVQLNSTTIITISDADNALISVGDIIRGSGLSTTTYAWVVTKNNEGANANTIVTTQHGITAAVATTLTIVSLSHDPVVLITPGRHAGDVTVSQRIVLKGNSREDTVLNGQLTIASACTVRDLTVSNNDSAVVIDAAYDSTADYYFYDCYVYSTDTVTLNPVLDLTVVTASANPRMYLIRSNVWRTGGVGDVAMNLNATNRILCENSSFIGIINLLGTGSIRFTDTTVSGGVFLTGAALGAPSTVVFMTRCSISSAALTCLNMDRANANATLIDTLLTGTGGAAQSAIDITAAATASYARLTFGGTNDTIDLNGVGTVVAIDITPTIVP